MRTEWCNCHPGDFVHLSCNEIIPADILLLCSSDHAGICHIETSNIDGENNLKQRQKVLGFENDVSFSNSCMISYLSLFSIVIFIISFFAICDLQFVTEVTY